MPELSVAYANKLNNFNKQVETAVETRAVQQFKLQNTADKEVEQIYSSATPETRLGKASPGRMGVP